MARGQDKENSSPTPPRRNPFRQEIVSPSERDKGKRQKKKSRAQRMKQFTEERFEGDIIMHPAEDVLVDSSQQAQKTQEDERRKKEALKARRKYLQKRGIAHFSTNSPGIIALERGGYHEDDYVIEVFETIYGTPEDQDLSYGYIVSREGETLFEGFASGKHQAENKASQVVQKIVEQNISTLKEEEESFIKRQKRKY